MQAETSRNQPCPHQPTLEVAYWVYCVWFETEKEKYFWEVSPKKRFGPKTLGFSDICCTGAVMSLVAASTASGTAGGTLWAGQVVALGGSSSGYVYMYTDILAPGGTSTATVALLLAPGGTVHSEPWRY